MAALFQEFRSKDIVLRNRIGVSPMCQYSSEDGHASDWHMVHLGSRAIGGAGLVVVEATAVTPEGRISPADNGLWLDSHIPKLTQIADFISAHGAVPGIQLAHAGRKASASKPWEGDRHLTDDEGGWQPVAPSPIAFGGSLPKVPTELSRENILSIQQAFVSATKRALAANFKWLELHFAHGYLAHEFYSPLANHRRDEYGGSFENRIRFLMQTLTAVREVWPERLPLTARLSVTDWNKGGVTVEESIELIRRMKAAGLDLIDVSHGFATPDISTIPWGPGFMIPVAAEIKRATGLPTAVGWLITEAQLAEQAVRSGDTDLVLLARELLRDPYWPYHAALELGDPKAATLLPAQYARAAAKR